MIKTITFIANPTTPIMTRPVNSERYDSLYGYAWAVTICPNFPLSEQKPFDGICDKVYNKNR